MCCFSRPVRHVAKTRIFARGSGPTQLLAYQMQFEAAGDLAMILPLPVPPRSPDDAVRFIDLEDYPMLFDDLSSAFPRVHAFSDTMLGAARGGPPPKQLEVHQVGQFEASFVPTLADFARLDERFRLPDGVFDGMPRYRDWGFAVFKLRSRGLRERLFAGPRTVHPMAFEFPRRDPSSVFFPTVHVHDGHIHPRAAFDHELYLQGADAPVEWIAAATEIGRHVTVELSKGLVVADQPCFMTEIEGDHDNRDVEITDPGKLAA